MWLNNQDYGKEARLVASRTTGGCRSLGQVSRASGSSATARKLGFRKSGVTQAKTIIDPRTAWLWLFCFTNNASFSERTTYYAAVVQYETMEYSISSGLPYPCLVSLARLWSSGRNRTKGCKNMFRSRQNIPLSVYHGAQRHCMRTVGFMKKLCYRLV